MEPEDGQLLSILDQLPLVIFRRSAKKNFEMEYLSSGIVQYLHSPLRDLLGPGYDLRLDPGDQDSLRGQLAEAAAQGKSYQASYRLEGQQVHEFGQLHGQDLLGHLHFAEVRQARTARFEYLVENDDPNLTPLQDGCVVAISREIPAAAEQQRQQLELERKLRVVFESSEIMSFLLSADGVVYEAGPAVAPFLAGPGQDPRGRQLVQLLREYQGPDVSECFAGALAQAARGYTQNFEARFDEADMQITVSPIIEGNQIQFYFVHCLDITERNANRDYARQSEQNLQDLFLATPSAMLAGGGRQRGFAPGKRPRRQPGSATQRRHDARAQRSRVGSLAAGPTAGNAGDSDLRIRQCT